MSVDTTLPSAARLFETAALLSASATQERHPNRAALIRLTAEIAECYATVMTAHDTAAARSRELPRISRLTGLGRDLYGMLTAAGETNDVCDHLHNVWLIDSQ